MIVIPLIPIMALVIQNIILLRDVIERKENLLVADRSVIRSDETARLIAALQRERTASLMQVSDVTNIKNDQTPNIFGLRKCENTEYQIYLVLEKVSNTEYQIYLVLEILINKYIQIWKILNTQYIWFLKRCKILKTTSLLKITKYVYQV